MDAYNKFRSDFCSDVDQDSSNYQNQNPCRRPDNDTQNEYYDRSNTFRSYDRPAAFRPALEIPYQTPPGSCTTSSRSYSQSPRSRQSGYTSNLPPTPEEPAVPTDRAPLIDFVGYSCPVRLRRKEPPAGRQTQSMMAQVPQSSAPCNVPQKSPDVADLTPLTQYSTSFYENSPTPPIRFVSGIQKCGRNLVDDAQDNNYTVYPTVYLPGTPEPPTEYVSEISRHGDDMVECVLPQKRREPVEELSVRSQTIYLPPSPEVQAPPAQPCPPCDQVPYISPIPASGGECFTPNQDNTFRSFFKVGEPRPPTAFPFSVNLDPCSAETADSWFQSGDSADPCAQAPCQAECDAGGGAPPDINAWVMDATEGHGMARPRITEPRFISAPPVPRIREQRPLFIPIPPAASTPMEPEAPPEPRSYQKAIRLQPPVAKSTAYEDLCAPGPPPVLCVAPPIARSTPYEDAYNRQPQSAPCPAIPESPKYAYNVSPDQYAQRDYQVDAKRRLQFSADSRPCESQTYEESDPFSPEQDPGGQPCQFRNYEDSDGRSRARAPGGKRCQFQLYEEQDSDARSPAQIPGIQITSATGQVMGMDEAYAAQPPRDQDECTRGLYMSQSENNYLDVPRLEVARPAGASLSSRCVDEQNLDSAQQGTVCELSSQPVAASTPFQRSTSGAVQFQASSIQSQMPSFPSQQSIPPPCQQMPRSCLRQPCPSSKQEQQVCPLRAPCGRPCPRSPECPRLSQEQLVQFLQNGDLSQILANELSGTTTRNPLFNILVKDNYWPGVIEDSVNGKIDFNRIAFDAVFGCNIPEHLDEEQVPMSLIEAFEQRILFEKELQENMERRREFCLNEQKKDVAATKKVKSDKSLDSKNDLESAADDDHSDDAMFWIHRDELKLASTADIDMSANIRDHPETGLTQALACLFRAEKMNNFDKFVHLAEAVIRTTTPDKHEKAAIKSMCSLQIDMHKDEKKTDRTYRPLEIISYIGTTKLMTQK